MLTDILNKAYSNLIFIRDAKDIAYLILKFNKASNNSISVLMLIKELLKYWFYLVLGSSLKIGTSKDSFLSFFYKSKDIVEIYLIKLIIKPLVVSIVEIRLSNLTIVIVSSAGSTNLTRYTS